MTTSLSIALVAAEWSADASGGATFERDVLRAFLEVPSTHRFVVYPDSPFARDAVAGAAGGARVSFVAPVREPNPVERIARRAIRMMRRTPPPLPFAGLSSALHGAGAQVAWMLGGSIVPLDIPYVATLWDLQHRRQPWFPEVSSNGEWRERERLYPEYLRRAATVVTGTAVGAGEVRDAYAPPGPLHVIPFPTPSFALARSAQPLSARPAGVPSRYILYPGQFWAHKNHVTAVRALAAMADMVDPPSLVLIGADRGTRDHVLREAEALGVGGRVHMLGFVDRDILVALYQHAEALLFPSLFGPDNLPPLEAMALGCPVVAARVAGAEEQLGDAALLIDGLDAGAYASAIRSLRDDPGMRAALIARGHSRARRWTAAQYAAAGLALIDEHIAPVRALWP